MNTYINDSQLMQAYGIAMHSSMVQYALVEFQTSGVSMSSKYAVLPYYEHNSLERAINIFSESFIAREHGQHVTANIISISDDKAAAMSELCKINLLKHEIDKVYRKKLSKFRHGVTVDVRYLVN